MIAAFAGSTVAASESPAAAAGAAAAAAAAQQQQHQQQQQQTAATAPNGFRSESLERTTICTTPNTQALASQLAS